MKIRKIRKWLKQRFNCGENLVLSNCLYVEYETDTDQYSFELQYNFKKNRYECSISVYHASEDNNAENVDSHTDEELFWDFDLKVLLEELTNTYEQNFLKLFYEDFKWRSKQVERLRN